MSQDPYRLPSNVRPVRYEIDIHPDLDKATFTGHVHIEVEVTEATDRIVLNSLDLKLSDASVGTAAVESIEEDPTTERVTLVLKDQVAVGHTTVSIGFSGVLNDKLMGFYRSTFDLPDPVTGQPVHHTIAVTQFESTHARAAFPCFDEPALKASFKISLTIDDSLFAVSNGAEVARTDLGDGLVRIDFAETMVMSTYLVAFVVGPLVATEPRVVAGANGAIPLRIIHTPGSEHLCGFALDVAEAALLFFEDYYEIPYPGDKVDLVAVPDFAFGAMENLGCITFREVLLLIDPDAATQPELQRVADVINHELAHMWFGDLVTMKWWNGIWLNEAFATFMENMASDSFRPDWDVWTNFGLARAAAFDTDSLSTTRPIEYEVISPADSEGMFDVLTYEKGASVVRMLEQYLGAEPFRRGIAEYLKQHSYGVTETTDLWDALEDVSGEPVRQIMDGWIFRGGHPQVVVEATSQGLNLTQVPFNYGDPETSSEPWLVPLRIRYQADGKAGTKSLLLGSEVAVDLDGPPERVQVNTGGAGFFRTRLSADLRSTLATDPESSPLERFVLIDDTCAALNAGQAESAEVWDLIKVIGRDETEPAIWRRIGAAARELIRLEGPSVSDRNTVRINDLTEAGLSRVKAVLVDGQDPTPIGGLARTQEVRGVIAALRGTVGANDHVREHTRQIFAMSATPATLPAAVDASLQAAAIEVVGYTATTPEHEELRRRWRDASTPQEELRYLNALVDTDNPELLAIALHLSVTEVRTQNAPYLLQRAIAHRSLAAQAWTFLIENWQQVTQRFPSNSLARMLSGIRYTTDEALAERIQVDLGGIELPSGQQQLDQHLERMWVTVTAARRCRDK